MNVDRYIRQSILKGFGQDGQSKLARAKILVVGAGGLGVPVLSYLNAMGVGTLGVVDNDTVSLNNLHRQVLYAEADLGKFKVDVAVHKLKSQNSTTTLIAHKMLLTVANAIALISKYDLVVDASDNFPTRYLVNDACVILKKPFVYGALHGFEGQVSVFNFNGGPTYRCLFKEMPQEHEVPNCNEHGVLGILPGIIGSFQALEAVKVVTGIGDVLSGKLLLYNALDQTQRKIKFGLCAENLRIGELRTDYGWDRHCQTIRQVEAYELPKLLALKVQLIDVRTPVEYENYHLEGSQNLPLDQLAERIALIDFSVPVYLLCQSGKRSETAARQLLAVRPEGVVFYVAGGLNQYLTTCP